MCEVIKLTNGLFKIEGSKNPFAHWLIVKIYGGKKMYRVMDTLEDCKQQVEEWDEDYIRLTGDKSIRKGIPGLLDLYYKEKGINKSGPSYFYVYKANTNELLFSGESVDIAKKLNTTAKYLNKLVKKENNILRKTYEVTKAPKEVCNV